MKIAASLYSSKKEERNGLIKVLDEHGIDVFHIDCNDDMGVFDDIRAIRQQSNTPIDLHIISSKPEKFLQTASELEVDYVTIQYESLAGLPLINNNLKTRYGLAIVTETDISVFKPCSQLFDYVLFMATTPGQSGGKFNQTNFRKIREFQKLFPGKKIHVDGGVNNELSFILRNMGVSLAVVGSYLFNSAYLGASILKLKHDSTDSHYLVKDVMLTEDLPLLNENKNSLKDILESIDRHNLGFTMVVDNAGKMKGMITNADVRKGLLRNYEKLNTLKTKDIINLNPVFVNENQTITELLKIIKNSNFPILYLPVVDDNLKVTGTITFTNLIKGES